MELDPRGEPRSVTYRLLTSTVIPRPIGWISTRGTDGGDNLAPYSYYNAIAPKPPVVMFSVSPADDRAIKDTLRNVRETGEFVCNLVTEDLVEAMDDTSEPTAVNESEFDAVGLEREPSVSVSAPRVAAAKVTMECTVLEEVEIKNNVVVFGEVVYMHADDDLLTAGKIDVRKIDAVGRLSGPYYSRVDRMEFERQF